MATTLDLFWSLSSGSKEERLSASQKLISTLEQFQNHFQEGTDLSQHSPLPDESPIDLLNAPDVTYAVRRLIRGLSSPRESSRLGFAVALTELLSRLTTITCQQITLILMDTTKTTGGMTGQETRDILLARLFGFTSIIQSGLLVRATPPEVATSSASKLSPSQPSDLVDILRNLFELGNKKSWLQESAWWTVSLAVDFVHSSIFPWREDAIRIIMESVGQRDWCLEKIALVLKLQTLFPDNNWNEILKPAFKGPSILSTPNLQTIVSIVKDSHEESPAGGTANGTSRSGSWIPQTNYAWNAVLDHLMTRQKDMFLDFFQVVVDETLFSLNASPQRKYLGFKITQSSLTSVDEDLVPMVFTKNFMRTWINQLSRPDRQLHKVAEQIVTEIQALVKRKPYLGFSVLLQLTGTNGSPKFDELTKTNTVHNIVSNMDAGGVQKYLSHILDQVNSPGMDKHALFSHRSWIIQQLGLMIQNQNLPYDSKWIQLILDWLTANGFFSIKKKPKSPSPLATMTIPDPPLNSELRQLCRFRLFACLATLCQRNNRHSPVPADDALSWIFRVIDTISNLQRDIKGFSVERMDDTRVTSARNVLDSLIKISDDNASAKGAAALVATYLLQFYSNEEDVSERLQLSAWASSSLFSLEGSNPDQPASAISVLVDGIMNALETASSSVKILINHAFSLLCPLLTLEALNTILNEVSNGPPTSSEEEDEEEVINDKYDSSGGMSESESSDEDEGPDPELLERVAAALGADAGGESSDSEDSGSEDELMNDDQMLAIDEQLAEVFRSKLGNKLSKAEKQEEHFKNRILDLLDIFVKCQPQNDLVTRLVVPLFQAVADASPEEKQLSDKAAGLLNSRFGKAKEFPHLINTSSVTAQLETLHSAARVSGSADTLNLCGRCCLFLVRVAVHGDGTDEVLRIYHQSLEDSINRKQSPLTLSFFHPFFQRYPSVAWKLRKALLLLSEKAINGYRRVQCYVLIGTILKQFPTLANNAEETADFLSTLQKSISALVERASNGKLSISPAQLKDILKVAMTAVRQLQRLRTAGHAISWDQQVWTDMSSRLSTSDSFKGNPSLQSVCTSIAQKCAEETVARNSTIESKTTSGKDKRRGDPTVGDGNAKKKRRKL